MLTRLTKVADFSGFALPGLIGAFNDALANMIIVCAGKIVADIPILQRRACLDVSAACLLEIDRGGVILFACSEADALVVCKVGLPVSPRVVGKHALEIRLRRSCSGDRMAFNHISSCFCVS